MLHNMLCSMVMVYTIIVVCSIIDLYSISDIHLCSLLHSIIVKFAPGVVLCDSWPSEWGGEAITFICLSSFHLYLARNSTKANWIDEPGYGSTPSRSETRAICSDRLVIVVHTIIRTDLWKLSLDRVILVPSSESFGSSDETPESGWFAQVCPRERPADGWPL